MLNIDTFVYISLVYLHKKHHIMLSMALGKLCKQIFWGACWFFSLYFDCLGQQRGLSLVFIYTAVCLSMNPALYAFRLCITCFKVLFTAVQVWMYFVLSQFKWTRDGEKSFLCSSSSCSLYPRSCALKAQRISFSFQIITLKQSHWTSPNYISILRRSSNRVRMNISSLD